MAFSISTTQLPRLRSYEGAVAYWNNQRTIKGRSTETRPLRTDGKHIDNFSIRQDSSGVVYCRLHATDLIAFHPNGVVHVDTRGWDSMSTHAFISAILNTHVRTFNLGQQGIISTRGYVRIPRGGIHLQPARTTGWDLVHPDDPNIRFTHNVLDRRKANAVKKAAAPFLAWVQAREALGTPVWLKYTPRLMNSAIQGGLTSHDLAAWDLAAAYASSAEHYIKRALVASKAVDTETLPLGEVPKRNQWNPVGALIV